MSITLLLVLLAIGGIGYFLYSNPRIREKLGMAASIKAENAVDKMTTAVEREKAVIREISAKIPAQRERVAKNQARVDKSQRDYDGAVKERDALKTKYETLVKTNRISKEAGDQIAIDFAAAKKRVADLEATLTEAKNVAAESERTANEFEAELKKAAAQITTDEGKADLAAAYRETAALRDQVKDLNSGLGTFSEAHNQIDNELDVARHMDENSQGSKVDREIKQAEKDLEAEQARKELEGDLSKDNAPKGDGGAGK